MHGLQVARPVLVIVARLHDDNLRNRALEDIVGDLVQPQNTLSIVSDGAFTHSPPELTILEASRCAPRAECRTNLRTLPAFFNASKM